MYSVKPQRVILCRGRISFHRQNVKQLLKRLGSKHVVAFGAERFEVSGKPDAWSIRKQRTLLDVAMEVGDTIFSATFFWKLQKCRSDSNLLACQRINMQKCTSQNIKILGITLLPHQHGSVATHILLKNCAFTHSSCHTCRGLGCCPA